jgi:hypothetical protein
MKEETKDKMAHVLYLAFFFGLLILLPVAIAVGLFILMFKLL